MTNEADNLVLDIHGIFCVINLVVNLVEVCDCTYLGKEDKKLIYFIFSFCCHSPNHAFMLISDRTNLCC